MVLVKAPVQPFPAIFAKMLAPALSAALALVGFSAVIGHYSPTSSGSQESDRWCAVQVWMNCEARARLMELYTSKG